MSLTYTFLTFYSYLSEYFNLVKTYVSDVYNDMEMQVLNNTFTEVYFYDYKNLKKQVIRNNTTLIRVLFLHVIKKYNVNWYLDCIGIDEFFAPYANTTGIFEIVYYTERQSKRYYTKQDDLVFSVHYMNKKPPHKYLSASLFDKYNVTSFINDHITSFHSRNPVKVIDIAFILVINGIVHEMPINENCNLKVIEDDTLEEMTFSELSNILLMHDE